MFSSLDVPFCLLFSSAETEAMKRLTRDEARRIAISIARLPELLGAN